MFQGLKAMFKRGSAQNNKYDVEEVGLHVVNDSADVYTFYFGNDTRPMFSLRGLSLSEPTKEIATYNGRATQVVKFGKNFTLYFLAESETINFTDAFTVQKSVRRKFPNGRHGLEIEALFGIDKVSYNVETVSQAKFTGFVEVNQDNDEATRKVPPLSQMVAFLKAILHQRRNVRRSLNGLSRHCSNSEVNEVIKYIGKNFTSDESFLSQSVLFLREALAHSGRRINLNSLAAMCILVDIFLEKITVPILQESLKNKYIVKCSNDACTAVKAFIEGEEPSYENETVKRGWNFLKSTVSGRTFNTILQDFAEDSGNVRTLNLVKKIIDVIPEENIQALSPGKVLGELLAQYGRKINANTLVSLCVFADIEANVIRESYINPFAKDCSGSMYSLVAVGRAFGVDLLCFNISAYNYDETLRGLNLLLKLNDKGAIIRCRSTEKEEDRYFFVRDEENVQAILDEGFEFSGHLIIELPYVGHINSEDLSLLLQRKIPVFASFIAEDGSRRWSVVDYKFVSNDPSSIVGSYGFIDGSKAYRFDHKVLGRLVKGKAESLLNKTNIITVYKNDKGERKYRYISRVNNIGIIESLDSDYTFAEETLEFPKLDDVSVCISEENGENISGVTGVENPEAVRLNGCLEGVKTVVQEKLVKLSLKDTPEVLQELRKVLQDTNFRNSLIEVFESEALSKLVSIIGKDEQNLRGSVSITEDVAKALSMPSLRNIAAMMILYSICVDKGNSLYDYRIVWAPEVLRSLIQESLFMVVRSDVYEARILACKLLSDVMFSSSAETYEAGIYVLGNLLNDGTVGEAISNSMARLTLASALSFEPFIEAGSWERMDVLNEAEREAASILVKKISSWLDTPIQEKKERLQAVPAMANLRAELPKIKVLSQYVSKLNSCLNNESSQDASYRYVVIDSGMDMDYRKRLLAAWGDFFKAKNLPISSKDYGSHILGEFWTYLYDYEKEKKVNVVMRNAEVFETATWYKIEPGIDPLFLKLASMIAPPAHDGLRRNAVPLLLRCSGKQKTGDDVDLGTCKIFSVDHNGWVPFMSSRFAVPMRLSAENRMLYDSLSDIYNVVMGRQNTEGEITDEVYPAGMIRAGEEQPEELDKIASHNLDDLTDLLVDSFRLSPYMRPRVLNILLSAKTVSNFNMPEYID